MHEWALKTGHGVICTKVMVACVKLLYGHQLCCAADLCVHLLGAINHSQDLDRLATQEMLQDFVNNT